jgi:hypothetical protein
MSSARITKPAPDLAVAAPEAAMSPQPVIRTVGDEGIPTIDDEVAG